MALDTREKRMNAARVGRPWMRAKHAVGATDLQSRIASGHGYGGNGLAPPVSVSWLPQSFASVGRGALRTVSSGLLPSGS